MPDLSLIAASACLMPALGWICITDIREFRIPDTASLGLVAAGLGFSAVSPLTHPADAVLGAAAGYLVFAVLGELHFRHTGEEGLGLGDAKLLAAAGAWLGWRELPLLVAAAALAALAFALVRRRRRIAFGPWLAGSFWIVWLVRVSA